MSEKVIAEGTRVTLNFALKLDDGSVVDSTFDKKPAELVMGDGNLPAGFESYLLGLKAGECGNWRVPPEKAFGQLNPNNLQTFARSVFAEDMSIEPGMMLSFADAAKNELPGVVKEVLADQVVVDFNHPLAGRALVFEVEILSVK